MYVKAYTAIDLKLMYLIVHMFYCNKKFHSFFFFLKVIFSGRIFLYRSVLYLPDMNIFCYFFIYTLFLKIFSFPVLLAFCLADFLYGAILILFLFYFVYIL